MKVRRVYIASEDSMTRQVIRQVLETYFHEFEVVGETESAAEALKSIKDLKPDVVIVDLNLKEGDALQLLSALRPIEFHTVFISSFNDYLIEALQFAQVDFVFKPFDISDLITTIDKVSDSHKPKTPFLPHHHRVETLINNITSSSKEIILKGSKNFITQSLHQIVWAEAVGSKSIFHFVNGSIFEANSPLRRFESMLQLRSFFRCHPFMLVNLLHIDYIDPVTKLIRMSNDDQVPYEERRYHQLTTLLGEERKVF